MQVVTKVSDFRLPASAVSVGMFDGVHRGHKRVLQSLRHLGQGWGVPTVLVTFDPHPRALLRPESAPAMLSTLDDRMRLLAATGAVDYCVVLPFDRRRSAEPADDFVYETLIRRFGMCALVVGENFACGRGRQGTVDYLRLLGLEFGYSVHSVALRVPSDPSGPVPCSSTEARRLIQCGDIGGAAEVLDRPHEVTCTVIAPEAVSGGFVDLMFPEAICSPPAGHYAGVARKHGKAAPWLPAVLQVQEGGLSRGRKIRLLNGFEAGVAPGDTITLRFLDKVRPNGLEVPSNSFSALA